MREYTLFVFYNTSMTTSVCDVERSAMRKWAKNRELSFLFLSYFVQCRRENLIPVEALMLVLEGRGRTNEHKCIRRTTLRFSFSLVSWDICTICIKKRKENLFNEAEDLYTERERERETPWALQEKPIDQPNRQSFRLCIM